MGAFFFLLCSFNDVGLVFVDDLVQLIFDCSKLSTAIPVFVPVDIGVSHHFEHVLCRIFVVSALASTIVLGMIK